MCIAGLVPSARTESLQPSRPFSFPLFLFSPLNSRPLHDFARPESYQSIVNTPSCSHLPLLVHFNKYFLYPSDAPLRIEYSKVRITLFGSASGTRLITSPRASISFFCGPFLLAFVLRQLVPDVLSRLRFIVMDSWRVAVLGDGGVGKTALAVQFTLNCFVGEYLLLRTFPRASLICNVIPLMFECRNI